MSAAVPCQSAIYEGTVRHRRYGVRARQSVHPIAFAYIDLDELPELLGGRLLSARPGAARFRRSDYHGPVERALLGLKRSGVPVFSHPAGRGGVSTGPQRGRAA